MIGRQGALENMGVLAGVDALALPAGDAPVEVVHDILIQLLTVLLADTEKREPSAP